MRGDEEVLPETVAGAEVRADRDGPRRWYVLGVMLLVYAINIADRYVVSTVLEPIRLELHLSDAAVGLLTGAALALFYVTVSLPVSALADRGNRRNIVAVSLLLWSAMTVACGFVRNFWQLLVARIGVGVGESGATPASTALIGDRFRPAERPMAMTVFTLGAPLGAWLGSDLAGRVADAHGWRGAFLALGAPGLVLGLVVFLTVREPRRAALDPEAPAQAESIPLRRTLARIWRNRAVMHLMAAGALSALWGWGLIWWAPAYFVRAFGLTVGQVGASLGAAHLVAGAGVTLLASWAMGLRVFRASRNILWTLAALTAISTVPSILMLFARTPVGALAMIWAFLPAIYFYIGPSIGLLQNWVPPAMRAQTTAISVLMGNVTNLVVAPVAVGVLSDAFAGVSGASASSLRWAMAVLALTGFWAAWHYWAAARALRTDGTPGDGGRPSVDRDAAQ
ncbi:MFS transporter [Phenylobacterium sp.]|uniref:spinster family MFS transporter n=1 Tax=Phenylobacterium sp. TaxID=1871053 RepID=UPI0025E4EE21|nr:MFS transporter [Phenylobacterium sp.]